MRQHLTHWRNPEITEYESHLECGRPGGLAASVFFRGVAWGILHAGGVVCRDQEAVVESPRLGVWPGVVGALHHDGGSGLVGMEAGWVGRAATAVDGISGAVGAKRALDAAVLRMASPGLGICGNPPALGGHRMDPP